MQVDSTRREFTDTSGSMCRHCSMGDAMWLCGMHILKRTSCAIRTPEQQDLNYRKPCAAVQAADVPRFKMAGSRSIEAVSLICLVNKIKIIRLHAFSKIKEPTESSCIIISTENLQSWPCYW